jgi:hypothetical protein
MHTRNQTRRRLRLRCAAALPVVLAIAACATVPPPTASLDAARQAIASAERSDAARYAPAELNQARVRLVAADAEVTGKKMQSAEWLANESRADAELASAKAGAAKARTMNDEMKRSTSTLIEEMQRTTGDKP